MLLFMTNVENKKPSSLEERLFPTSANRAEDSTSDQDDLIELNKEAYFKASQIFYQREKRFQSVSLTAGMNHWDRSPSKSVNLQSDWNEIGLPVPNLTTQTHQCNVSKNESNHLPSSCE